MVMEWIRTAALVAGAVIALVGLCVTVAQLRQLYRQREEEQRRSRREHASQISAWLLDSRLVKLSNISNFPAAHVSIRTYDEAGVQQSYFYQRSANPGQHVVGRASSDSVSLSIAYTDNNGRRWRRNRHLRLEEFARTFSIASEVDLKAGLEGVRRELEADFGVRAIHLKHSGGRQLRAALKAGFDAKTTRVLDAIVGADDWCGELAAAEAIRAISPAREISAGSETSRYWKRLENGTTYYGVPVALDTVVLHVNRELLGSVQLRTLNALMRATHEFSDSNRTHVGLTVRSSSEWGLEPFLWWPFLQNFRVSLFTADHDQAWGNEIGVSEDNDSVKNLQSFRKSMQTHPDLRRLGPGHERARERFATGEAAVLVDTLAARHSYAAIADSVTVEPFPRPGNSAPGVYMIHTAFVSSFGPNRTIAQDFLATMMANREISEGLARGLGLPVPYGDAVLVADEHAKVAYEAIQDCWAMPNGPHANCLWSWSSNFLRDVIYGSVPVDLVLRQYLTSDTCDSKNCTAGAP